MDHVQTVLDRSGLHGAASLPQVADGDGLGKPKYKLKQRPNGKWAIFEGWRYLKSCKTRDRVEADRAIAIFELQQEAKREGIVDARWSDVIAIFDHYLEQIPDTKPGVRRNDTHRLKRLREHVAGLRLFQLNGQAVKKITKLMAKRYAASTVQVSWAAARTAIRVWCRDNCTPLLMPFDPPERAAGRERVIEDFERDIVLRWARCEEDYDPATGTWTKLKKKLGKRERHRRMMTGRALEILLPTGGRPGRLEGLAYAPHRKYGHVDLDTGIMYRRPIGKARKADKLAPPVKLSPELLAKFRAWKAADAGQAFVIRGLRGGPLTRKLGPMFSAAMKELGIEGVTLHTLRHSCITRLVRKRVPARRIAAVVGISLQVLKDRYDHVDDVEIQPEAHPAMDATMH
jgi:integrase